MSARVSSGVGSKQDVMLRSAEPRFVASVQRGDGCWPWLGGLCAGYGWFYVGGGRAGAFSIYAHRAALFYATGRLGRVGMHECDNRKCCRVGPGHLKWADHRENSRDARDKGRAYKGEANSNSKLTEETVRRIRSLRGAGATYKTIAEATGASVGNVAHVATGNTWAHVS